MSQARTVVVMLAVAILASGWTCSIGAERLPLRHYSTADGLSSDYVIDIYRDSRGFLWFSTRDGLSRFDGAEFRSYGTEDGIGHATINCVLETRDGTLWVGTNGGGVSRFQPKAQPRFVTVRVGDSTPNNRVNVLYEDAAGRLWAGTDDGAFVRDAGDTSGLFRPVDLFLPADMNLHGVADIVGDAGGSLWFSGGFGVRRRLPDARIVRYQVEQQAPRDSSTAMLLSRDQRIWVGFRRGLLALAAAPPDEFGAAPSPLDRVIRREAAPGDDGRTRWYHTADGLPSDIVTTLHQSEDGHVWAGTTRGLAQMTDGRFRAFGESSGLPSAQVSDLAEDTAGNLWIATVAGVVRLVRHGMVTYSDADGLGHSRIHSLGEDPAGAIVVVSGDFQVSRFDGRRFDHVRMRVAPDATCTWMSPCGRIDRAGDWWMLTTRGLAHWPAAAGPGALNRPPAHTFGLRDGLPDESLFSAFADSRGRLWVGAALGGISVWEPERRTWRTFSEREGLPKVGTLAARVNVFAEDRQGRMWVGFEGGGLARERNGRFEQVGPADGAPASSITALYVDAEGRLLIGSSQNGLGRIHDPSAESIVIKTFTAADGLASNNVRTIVDDLHGRVYAGHSRGVDRIAPDTGVVTHYTVSEGLGSQFVTASLRDRSGSLWFGTMSGLSRLDPAAGPVARTAAAAPAVFISRVRAAGVPQPVSELGDTAPPAFDLPASSNRLEIEFFAVHHDTGAPLRYQYRLRGISSDDDAWSSPSEQRSVHFAALAPATYAFEVRAVRADGQAGTDPAVVRFSVLPPFYATWWFLGSSALLAVGLAAAAYRVRVAQLLRVERIRARIATDLHDDIGSSLSQIAILAEVARTPRSPQASSGVVADPLARIAETARTLMDSMSDIVWAINPERDALSDLVHRMRRFVEDTLGSADIDVTFNAPDSDQHLRLGADIRREVFLILKESVTNIAKHAGCRLVTITMTADRRRLTLEVADDGKGFDATARTDGNGVASMRRRVAALGGTLAIHSAPGQGTRIRLELLHQ